MGNRGFALATVLALLPVMAMMSWTYLKIGTTTRAQALLQEQSIRAYQAAEAGLRCYLTVGQAQFFRMNGCQVSVSVKQGQIKSIATPEDSTRSTTMTLEIEKGFVVRRMTNEEN